MLEVGIISDTHGLLRPEALEALAGCELILHAGDVGSPDILERLAALAPVETVRGNVDRGEWAEALPSKLEIPLGSLVLYLHHGHLAVAEEELGGFGVVVQGHSHRPVVLERNGTLYMNPGSAGPRRFRLPVTLARLRVDGRNAQAELIDLLGERRR
ncbi:MAG TPA: metallophosphoesterase family protein [Trueperaceae bacterium]